MKVHKSLHTHAPVSISDLLTSVADVAARSALRTSSSGDVVVPRIRRRISNTAFSVAGDCFVMCPRSASRGRNRNDSVTVAVTVVVVVVVVARMC